MKIEKKIEFEKIKFDYSPYRETIEWGNYWWDKANEKRDDRILLIGDSTSREYRSTLAEYTGRPVDFIGSSSAVTDELFLKELELFFSVKEYQYSVIHMQIGVHGIVPEGEKIVLNDYPDYYKYYEESYREVVLFLKEHCKRLILATVTPVILVNESMNPILRKLYVHLHTRQMEKIDQRFEKGIVKRNAIVHKIGNELQIPVNDLYNYMNTEGYALRHVDHVHYENKSKLFIARRVAAYCKGELK